MYKALERDVIINEAQKVKPGTITRICYKIELPVKAEFKHQGYKMFKVVETSARLGVNYHKIASVIARKAEEGMKEAIKRTNNYEWVLKNKVRHNTSTGKDYLYVASFNKGHHTKCYYVIISPEGPDMGWYTPNEFINTSYKNYLIPSYWNKHSGPASEVKNISFENIYRIGGSGEKIDNLCFGFGQF